MPPPPPPPPHPHLESQLCTFSMLTIVQSFDHLQFLADTLHKILPQNPTTLKNHSRYELHFHYQARRGICTHDIQVWTQNSLWLGKYGLKQLNIGKRWSF